MGSDFLHIISDNGNVTFTPKEWEILLNKYQLYNAKEINDLADKSKMNQWIADYLHVKNDEETLQNIQPLERQEALKAWVEETAKTFRDPSEGLNFQTRATSMLDYIWVITTEQETERFAQAASYAKEKGLGQRDLDNIREAFFQTDELFDPTVAETARESMIQVLQQSNGYDGHAVSQKCSRILQQAVEQDKVEGDDERKRADTALTKAKETVKTDAKKLGKGVLNDSKGIASQITSNPENAMISIVEMTVETGFKISKLTADLLKMRQERAKARRTAEKQQDKIHQMRYVPRDLGTRAIKIEQAKDNLTASLANLENRTPFVDFSMNVGPYQLTKHADHTYGLSKIDKDGNVKDLLFGVQKEDVANYFKKRTIEILDESTLAQASEFGTIDRNNTTMILNTVRDVVDMNVNQDDFKNKIAQVVKRGSMQFLKTHGFYDQEFKCMRSVDQIMEQCKKDPHMVYEINQKIIEWAKEGRDAQER